MDKGHVSWISPIAKALIKAKEGDSVKLETPKGMKTVDILSVTYQKLS
jgi:transcription elongation factor GreB